MGGTGTRRLAACWATGAAFAALQLACGHASKAKDPSTCTPATFFEPRCQTKEAFRYRLARLELLQLQNAQYWIEVDCPGLGWLRAIATTVPETDPWGTAYHVTCEGGRVEVTSAGPDRKLATTDDLRLQRPQLPPPPFLFPDKSPGPFDPCPTFPPCPPKPMPPPPAAPAIPRDGPAPAVPASR